MRSRSDHTGAALSATDSEKQIIAVTLEGRTSWMPAALRLIPDANAFTDSERCLLWQTATEMARANRPISYDTIAAELRQTQADLDPDSLVLTHAGDHAIHDDKTALWHVEQIAYSYARRLHAEASEHHHTADVPASALISDLRQKADAIEQIAIASGSSLPKPLPLTAQLPPVLSFDPAWMPKSMRPWISDIAERMQCPPDFPAVAAMSALSSVAGRRFCIQPKALDESWFEFPTLWGMIIGRPSLMKSPAMQAAMRPLRALEVAANETHQTNEKDRCAAKIKSAIERKLLEQEARAAVKNDLSFDFGQLLASEDEASPHRRYIVNDASVEALGEVLRANPLGTLLYQDELAGLLAMIQKDGNQTLRTFMLQAWSGKEAFTFDRIGRGTRRIDHCLITVLGSIQPGVIGAHVRAANADNIGADGFMQRFSLMVWPDPSKKWRNIDRPLDKKAEEDATEVFNIIENLTVGDLDAMGAIKGRDDLPTFRFDADAQDRFNRWLECHEARLRSDGLHHSIESHLAKYRKLVPALAVLIHVAETQCGQVSLDAVERSLLWAEYLESHARRVYEAGNASSIEPARSLLNKLLNHTSSLPENFTAREVYRKGWSGLSRPDDTEAACEILVDHGCLIATQHPSGDRGGRPTFSYHLNPRARVSHS